MKSRVSQWTVLGLLLFAILILPAQASGQVRAFVENLDVRCYKIFDRPLGLPLTLDHLNPVFREYGAPTEDVILWEPQDLCVPVAKNDRIPPPEVLRFIQFVDWKCYRIEGPSLDLPLQLDHLNRVIVDMFGKVDRVIVREPQQLCVPVVKDLKYPPPEVQRLVEWLDVKCYRVDSDRHIGGEAIRLTHLNPLFWDLEPEVVFFQGPAPNQLCVPVAKNGKYPPDDIRRFIEFSDVLCYDIRGRPLDRKLRLDHLNPVLLDLGLKEEYVYVGESHKLCVPVAKNGRFPPD